MAVLKRQAISGSVIEQEFCERVKTVLNYSVQHSLEDEKLKQVLMDLKIRPFKAKTVQKYKRKQAKTYWNDTVYWTVTIVGWLIAIGGLVTAGITSNGVLALISLPSIVMLPIIVFAVSKFKGVEIREWRLRRLDNYSEPLPEFVLQTALDIKEKYPEAVLTIETLESSTDLSHYLSEARGRGSWVGDILDPFLVVQAKQSNEKYYVEVWNEPGFHQDRVY